MPRRAHRIGAQTAMRRSRRRFCSICSAGRAARLRHSPLDWRDNRSAAFTSRAALHTRSEPAVVASGHAAADGTCARRVGRVLWRRGEFIDRYVFPDGELVPFGTVASAAERAGFETRDVEALREHYARTLRHWVTRLRSSWDRAVPMVGEETARTWLLYMAASAQAFTSGRLNLIQLLLGKRTDGGIVHIPSTRGDIYAPSEPASPAVIGSIRLVPI